MKLIYVWLINCLLSDMYNFIGKPPTGHLKTKYFSTPKLECACAYAWPLGGLFTFWTRLSRLESKTVDMAIPFILYCIDKKIK